MQWSTVIMDSSVLHTALQAAKIANYCRTECLIVTFPIPMYIIVKIIMTWWAQLFPEGNLSHAPIDHQVQIMTGALVLDLISFLHSNLIFKF